MERSKYVAILVIGVVVIGLLAAQYSLNNPTPTTEALTAGSKVNVEPQSNDGPATQDSTDSNTADSDTAESNAADSDTANSETVDTQPASGEQSVPAPPSLGPAPTLTSLDGWLNTDATSFDSFSGQVRIVQFWTYSCHNCTATIPHLQEIYADYEPQGLEIIGVHAPEFEFERDRDNVAAAAQELGVTWPVALDTEKTNFRSWQKDRRFWPRTYVLDQNGEIRFDHIGEGDYEELAATVGYLIENGP